MAIENVRSISRDVVIDEPSPTPKRQNPLDSEAAQSRHGWLWGLLSDEKERQSVNRYQMALDEDFKDNLQWSEEEINELLERYQAPMVLNLVHQAVKWITGTEKRTRVDFKVLPREPGDIQGAHVKTQLLKYVSDVNRTAWHRSHAFEDAVAAGVGWIEDGVRSDPTEETIFSGYEHWRNIFYDSLNRTHDESRSRYLFRERTLDLDMGLAMFPKRAAAIESAAAKFKHFDSEDDLYYLGERLTTPEEEGWVRSRYTYTSGFSFGGTVRDRVKLIEAWYRVPMRAKVMVAQDRELTLLHGQQYDPSDELHKYAVQEGAVTLADAMRQQVRVAVMTDSALLQDMPSPYRHGRFGLTPIWGYRRKRDGAPYGVVRLMRDAQSDLNKRRSKSLFLLSTVGVVMDGDANTDIEEIRQEVARPDYVLVKKSGREMRVERHTDLAQAHYQMELADAQYIHQTSGVTAENLGLDSNAQSGRAVIAKQQQGSLTTQDLFDNLRYAFQIQGENQLSLIEQYYTDERIIRITGSDGNTGHLSINQAQPDGQVANDVVRAKADFVVAAADYTETVRMALFEQLMQLLGRLPPEISMRLLSSAMELVDLPMRDKLVSKIREITGEPDTEVPQTPEEEQRQEARRQQMAQQQAMQQQAAQLDMEERAATADQKRAAAEKARAEAQAVMAELEAQINGAGTEREKELLRELQRLQNQLWDAKVKNAELQVENANKADEIHSDQQTKLMTHALSLASQEKQHERSIEMQRETAQHKAKMDADTARHRTETDAEVKRENAELQARTQEAGAKHKVASDEKVGMAKGGKTASQMGRARSTPLPANPNAGGAQPVIGELHVHIPASVLGQDDKPKRRRKSKTMTIEGGGKTMVIKTQEDD